MPYKGKGKEQPKRPEENQESSCVLEARGLWYSLFIRHCSKHSCIFTHLMLITR